jgi:outer membrane protein TolC
MEKISWVYDFFRKIAVVAYEIGDAIFKSIGVALDNVVGRMNNIFGVNATTSDILGTMVAIASKFTASIIPQLLTLFLKLENIFSNFIIALIDTFPMFADGGAKGRLNESLLRNNMAIRELERIQEVASKNIDAALGLQTKVDFATNARQAELAAKEAMLNGQRALEMARPLFDTTKLEAKIKENQAKVAAAQTQIAPALQQALKVISSFVGSAAQSRGNLVRAMSAEKQAQEAIKENTRKTADGVEELVKNGGQLVFTS